MLTLNVKPLPAEAVVKTVLAETGNVDVITWYEGTKGLPLEGAVFLQTQLLDPLKGKARFCLYSLCGWDFKRKVSKMPTSTALGERMGCVYASSFFQFCLTIKDGPLFQAFQASLPKKQWLFALSEKSKNAGVKVGKLFDNAASLLSCLYNMTTGYAYSAMQYVEGYYLVRESVRKALSEKKTELKVFFVLPNDEGKYYTDLPKEIEELLKLDFGEKLTGFDLKVTFLPYNYGSSLASRPYIEEVPPCSICRYDIHNLY